MIINQQKPEKEAPYRTDGRLDVHSIFDTIQGEGPFAGTPATFIRLAGCSLACNLCDTEYTAGRELLSPSDIFTRLAALPYRKLIVLTGGEPFRQDFYKFFMDCVCPGQILQVETNGLHYREFLDKPYTEQIVIVCSPKTPQIDERMWPLIDALKYVVKYDELDPNDGLPIKSVGTQYGIPAKPGKDFRGEIFIQPLDEQDPEKNKRNLEAAVESCMKHNYRLCIQTHKLAHLP